MKLFQTAVCNRGKLENFPQNWESDPWGVIWVVLRDSTILRNDYVIRYLEDFEPSNIEDTDEARSFSGCFVERFINSIYDPLEEFLVKSL